jgi:hypothetical protein
MKKLTCVALLLIFPILSNAQLVINEGSNRNYQTLPDEDEEFKDWIELYNAGTDTVHLNGYSLTDNPNLPQKWMFPDLSIAPGAYKPIFCSGKDRRPLSGFTHVVTSSNYNPTTGWNTHIFTTPFYWDGSSNVLINTCSYSSVGYTVNSQFLLNTTPFNSSRFVVQDGSDAACSSSNGSTSNLRPNMRLNSTTIGVGTQQNSPTDYPAPYGNWYWGARHQFLILASELSAAGMTAGMINSLSFEVANTDPNMVYDYIDVSMKLVSVNSLNGVLEPLNPEAYQHTNFTIDPSGETVRLFDNNQIQISTLLVDCINLDESKGLSPDAGPNFVRFDPPTPIATNNNSTIFYGHLSAPVFSAAPGIYPGNLSVTMSHSNGPTAQIRYTLNGNEPTPTSSLYTGTPVSISSNTVVKARVFDTGILPSPVEVSSYLIGVDHTTPILSITTPPSNLYGPTGIFDNWWQDWQRNAHLDYFTEDNQLLFSQHTGMQVDGGWGGSRSHPQHSFRLELDNGVLGEGPIYDTIIPNRPDRTKYSTFYLRNGSNQFNVLPYKDAVQVECMAGATNNYHSAWRPVTVYINGEYNGLYELREKFDDEYFEVHDGADPDSLDMLSLSAWYNFALRAVIGSPVDTFQSNYALFNALDPTLSTYWDAADQYFDQTYYVDYIIGESWMGNVDWPGNNIKIMRSNATGNRYRFCTIDLELAMAPNSWTTCYDDHISYLLGQSPDNPYINVWLQGMQNNRFHDYFINRFADVMNTAYLPERILTLEDSFFSQVSPEMPYQFARWGDPNAIPQQMSDFNANHFTFRTQLFYRSQQVRNHLESNFNLGNQVDVVLDVHPAGAGTIKISTIQPDEYPWNGIYFNRVPIQIEALPNPGFQFSHWDNNGLIEQLTNSLFLDTLDTTSIQFDAYFAVSTASTDELSIEQNLVIYPNPMKEKVTVVLPTVVNEERVRCAVRDLSGRTLFDLEYSNKQSSLEIDTHSLSGGIYVIEVMNESGKSLGTGKCVKL